jgi:hypothetical protein
VSSLIFLSYLSSFSLSLRILASVLSLYSLNSASMSSLVRSSLLLDVAEASRRFFSFFGVCDLRLGGDLDLDLQKKFLLKLHKTKQLEHYAKT